MDGSDRAEDGAAASYPIGHQTGREFHTVGYEMKDNAPLKPNLHSSQTRNAGTGRRFGVRPLLIA